ncbi:MAG: hypothetical protein QOJ60_1430 [Actinomycetota bacterium]|nr:hypothetical protein [Actinomycetota bacterium]
MAQLATFTRVALEWTARLADEMRTMRRTRLLAAVLTAALPAALVVGATTTAGGAIRSIPGTSCTAFPSNNYWHADISKLPVNSHNRAWKSHMSSGRDLHPDFGPSYGAQPVPYGIPITVAGGSHAKHKVSFTYSSESDHVGYPLGSDTRIEGGWNATGDRHAVIVDKSTCRLYETWLTRRRSDGTWHAGSGATWSLTSNKLRPNGWTSADAAGLPILPGVLRYDEVAHGYVDHAIRFTTDVTDRRHIWPARHDAGSVSNHNYPPMGARFRLRAGFPIGSYRADTRVVLKAMKRYGLVLADNGSPWYFQGTQDTRWPAGLLDQLKSIPASAFVAVDTSSMKVDPDSGRVATP